MKKALYVGLIVECVILFTASLEAQLSKCYTLLFTASLEAQLSKCYTLLFTASLEAQLSKCYTLLFTASLEARYLFHIENDWYYLVEMCNKWLQL